MPKLPATPKIPKVCPVCGSRNIEKGGGCWLCRDCGESPCK